MSSWSCPHFDPPSDSCRRLDAACVLGRKGCVLPRTLRFAVPPEERVPPKKNAKTSPAPLKPVTRKPR
jgi:hypothetical protein